MKIPLVDVIVPTYNRAYCLSRCVDSVLEQTHANCRAIVVDDGSTDGTANLMQDRYGGNARVMYVHRANGGVSAARNTGFARSDGDCVALLDSDDYWKPWKIALQLRCLAAAPGAGMVWTDMSAVDAEGRVTKERYLRDMYSAYRRLGSQALFENSRPLPEVETGDRDAGGGPDEHGRAGDGRLYWGDIFSNMVQGNLVHTSTVMLTRERLQRVHGFDVSLERSGEDYDFHLRTCREGPVAFADVPAIYYRVGSEDQLTQPAYHLDIARNHLRTIQPILQRDRARIRMTDAQINALLARSHAWVSNEMFQTRDIEGARHHALESLRLVPMQARLWMILGCSLLPQRARTELLHLYHRLKSS